MVRFHLLHLLVSLELVDQDCKFWMSVDFSDVFEHLIPYHNEI